MNSTKAIEGIKRSTYSPDETEDYDLRDTDDIPTQTRRFCFTHNGYEACPVGAIGCEVVDESARQAVNAKLFEYFYVS